jgi:hypothetical protein
VVSPLGIQRHVEKNWGYFLEESVETEEEWRRRNYPNSKGQKYPKSGSNHEMK